MKNRAYSLPNNNTCPIRSFWCDVSCGYDGTDASDLCHLFQSVNCGCTGRPFKFKSTFHWCDVSCVMQENKHLCLLFQSINCPGPVINFYRGWWCSVTCSKDDPSKSRYFDRCKLFQELNCTGRPPKKTNSHWCDVPCGSKNGLCPTFKKLNC